MKPFIYLDQYLRVSSEKILSTEGFEPSVLLLEALKRGLELVSVIEGGTRGCGISIGSSSNFPIDEDYVIEPYSRESEEPSLSGIL